MATFTAQLARNGMAARVVRAMIQARRSISTTALTALSSKRALPTALRGAAAIPAAALRTSAPCCSASADDDVVEIQLKVKTAEKGHKRSRSPLTAQPSLSPLSPYEGGRHGVRRVQLPRT